VKIIKIFGFFLLQIILINSNSFLYTSTQKKHLSDSDIKKKLMKHHEVKKEWGMLSMLKIFPKPQDEKKGYYLNYPVDLCVYNNKHIFIVDNRTGKVVNLSLELEYISEFGRRGQGPGEFSRAGQIGSSEGGELYVTDSGRIQIFNTNGEFLRSFKIFNTLNDILIRNKNIYANCIDGFYERNDEEKPLVIRYNSFGKISQSFGKKINQNQFSIDSRAYLSQNKSEILVAFKHYPIINIYSDDGNLKRNIRVKFPILEELEKYNYDKNFTNPVPGIINLPRLIAGIDCYGDKIFLLLHLPRIEILELETSGKICNVYYSQIYEDIIDLRGFKTMEINGGLSFLILLSSPEKVQLAIFGTDN